MGRQANEDCSKTWRLLRVISTAFFFLGNACFVLVISDHASCASSHLTTLCTFYFFICLASLRCNAGLQRMFNNFEVCSLRINGGICIFIWQMMDTRVFYDIYTGV